MKLHIHLDFNSTTPVDLRVLEAMLPYSNPQFEIEGSSTHLLESKSLEVVEKARHQVASLIGSRDEEIIFTSSATEAINLVMNSVYERYAYKGNHIITVKTEHKAVLEACNNLIRKGAEISYLNVNAEGLIDLNELQNLFTEKTILTAVMFANNETGVLQPLKKISEIVHANNSILFSDATQAAGKIDFDVAEFGIDLLCVTGHKFYGPKGIGALYVGKKNTDVVLREHINIASKETNFRLHTLKISEIVGLGLACQLAQKEMWDNNSHISALRANLEHQLLDFSGLRINGSTKNRLYNTSNICFHGKKSVELFNVLRKFGVSFGSSSNSLAVQPSHVLKSMGMSDEDAFSSVRFSLGKFNTQEQILEVINSIRQNIYA